MATWKLMWQGTRVPLVRPCNMQPFEVKGAPLYVHLPEQLELRSFRFTMIQQQSVQILTILGWLAFANCPHPLNSCSSL